MYRISPVTYLVNAMASTGVAGVDVACAAKELIKINPPAGRRCGSYLQEYITFSGARLLNPNASGGCQVCPASTTNDVLATLGIFFDDQWRNFGISLVYSATNVVGALLLYWLFRARTGLGSQRGQIGV